MKKEERDYLRLIGRSFEELELTEKIIKENRKKYKKEQYKKDYNDLIFKSQFLKDVSTF